MLLWKGPIVARLLHNADMNCTVTDVSHEDEDDSDSDSNKEIGGSF